MPDLATVSKKHFAYYLKWIKTNIVNGVANFELIQIKAGYR